MQDIAELERRITAAMERITQGVDRLAGTAAPAGEADEIARLNEALDEERMANAQLNERVRVLRERLVAGAGQGETVAEAADAAHAELTAKLSAQEEELATLRRVLGEAGKEIASLRAARAAEAAELAEITAALEPLVTEAQHAGS